MRIARVIGKVVLNRRLAEFPPASYLLVRPLSRDDLADCQAEQGEEVVLYDELAAREGDRVGLVEGREASAPFLPAKVPCDAYGACILDCVDFRPAIEPGPKTASMKP